MRRMRPFFLFSLFAVTLILFLAGNTSAQNNSATVLTGAALTRVVPASFYFAGQSAPTQIRNSAAAQLGADRFVVTGLVDTSGYSTEISGKYEGFLITDSPVMIGDQKLETGAYGFGFSKDGSVKIFDLSSKQILSVKTTKDAAMNRPRPLTMIKEANGIRFYRGKDYVVIAAQ